MKAAFKIVTKKFPIMANCEMRNGKTIYKKQWAKAGERTVHFVHSKIDDCLLFESTSQTLVNNFCNTTNLR